MERRVGSVLVGIALAAQMLGQVAMPSLAVAAPVRTAAEASVVARLPIGTGRGEVGVEEAAEGTWGVSSFAVGPDGGFYIVDGVNDKVVVLDARGTLEREIPLPEPLVGPEDIAVTARGIYLMDVAAQPGLVCRLAEDGSIARSWVVPDEYAMHAATGIVVQDAEGEDIFLELDGSWDVPFVDDGRVVSPQALPLVRRGNRADVPAGDAAAFGLRDTRPGLSYRSWIDAEGGHEAAVVASGRGGEQRELKVRTRGEIGRLKALGRDASGRDYVLVEEAAPNGSLSEVRVFSDGVQTRAFRVPLERFTAWPHRYLRIDDRGEAYCLVPGDESVTVERLEATAEDGAVPAEPAERAETASTSVAADWWRAVREYLSPASAYAIWDRLDANDRAWAYVNDRWYCSSANYTRSCGDYRPAYITSSGKTYTSVPYCWGGFDTAGTFNTAMGKGLDAGDVNTSGSKRSCTAGVDCSGFVSRIWGLGTKRSTSTLDDISYPISRSSMKVADLYLWLGHHAIAFRYFTSTGDSAVWESTTSSDKDRVVAWTRTASYLRDSAHYYSTRRYNNW